MTETGDVEPDPETNNPCSLWENVYSKNRICRKISPFLSQDAPVREDAVRFVCISDTHDSLDKLVDKIPYGDVLVHCGDFTNYGDLDEILRFNEQIGRLPHKRKIVIAGNHELGFEDGDSRKIFIDERYAGRGTLEGYKMLTNCTYLHDKFVEVCGIRIYGSSWHPLPGYSFYRRRGKEILDEWLKIPTVCSETPIDVLLTHTPPLGHSDQRYTERWGCTELLNCVERRIKPKFHVFGHVHEQNGLTTNDKTVFINASICNHFLEVVNLPVLFDIPLPAGQQKKLE